jgi:hypothetical protein
MRVDATLARWRGQAGGNVFRVLDGQYYFVVLAVSQVDDYPGAAAVADGEGDAPVVMPAPHPGVRKRHAYPLHAVNFGDAVRYGPHAVDRAPWECLISVPRLKLSPRDISIVTASSVISRCAMKRHSGALAAGCQGSCGRSAIHPGLILVMACRYVAGRRRGECGATGRPGCVIPGLRGCLLCSVAVAARVLPDAAADAPPEDVLAQALEANRQLSRLVEELRAENAQLREEAVRRDAELEQVKAALGVLQRMVSGRSSERSRPQAAGRDGDGEGPAGTGIAGAEGPGGAGRARGRVGATGHGCRTSR